MVKDFTKLNGQIRNQTQKISVGKLKGTNQSEKIAKGKDINKASDDLAGFALAEQIHAQIKGLDMASKNSQDGVSMLQTAEGSLSQVNEMLTRAKELTLQASNGTLSSNDRSLIQEELQQLGQGIEELVKNTEFNEKKLLDGSSGEIKLQVGANEGQLKGVDFSTDFNEIAKSIKNLDVNEDLTEQLDIIDKSINDVLSIRSEVGSTINAIGSTLNSIDNSNINLSTAKSSITDTDMAKTMMENIRYSFRRDTITTMLAQSEELLGGLGSVVH